ncbi:hypothetical protein [Streptomyces sp. f51]|uniref:hypothetical protein n=1 Tax=Streptomyces sp. f51 TaxID=1827742 RepID=UPI00117EA893|nr:hypothetical protein [Streptomyces sp. f51]
MTLERVPGVGEAHPDAMESAAAAARRDAAQVELRAAQLREETARLTPRERSERRVARMLLTATPAGQETQLDIVPLATIQEELSLGRTTASEMRRSARGGSRPG